MITTVTIPTEAHYAVRPAARPAVGPADLPPGGPAGCGRTAARAFYLAAACSAAAMAAPHAAAAAPRVVADIAPVHSIVARVMDGVGTPELLLPPAASPHGHALRPSEAAALEAADLVVWIGEPLTPWLAGPLAALASDAVLLPLAEADGVAVLPVRAGGPFEAHEHDHHDHDHDHDHDGHDHDHDADHNHEHEHEHAAHLHHDHAEAHGHHAAGDADGHLWLDPMNAVAMAGAIAAALSEADPNNADRYGANAAAFAKELEALSAEVEAELAPLRGRRFIVFHDAYQYFEARFDLPASGSISLHDGDTPSAARMSEIRTRVQEVEAACAFAEPQFDQRLIATAIEGTEARTGVLDPLGARLEPGSDLYTAVLRGLASDLSACLAPG